jgi:hypothetical protein
MPNPRPAAAALALLLAALAPAPLAAQAAPPAAGPQLPKLVLEPEAEAALNRMGASLRALSSFEAVSDFSFERVYPGNHKIMSTGRTTYTVQQPDRMVIDMAGADTHRRLYFNGKAMTLHAVNANRYVTFPASGSIADVLGAASRDYGLELPLQDLFRWGDPSSNVVRPTAGYRLGDGLVNGRRAVHYAFTQPGVDFQVWLDESGAQALPVKMVITNTEHPAQPQFIAHYSWNQAPTLTADSFTFRPGPADRLIDFGTAKAVLDTKGK